ncbi:hydroxyacid dehydrogenase [Hydrogenophaga crassostreae]|uniref:Hydroxyacid dehydrogenase n=1 Tax=Hydrogenophaga crassostreae TaxID=1763535 RepID=A0A167HMT7_9BURK|nr:NAD(P)-dependent oxidoreductase [Hydrogenophaga crassostreae]AOW14901.1 hydroxyacid dehydrogenase [Hydrogenophaga crassostreae]OAD41467.1 hydroxyacid dehydrogenase [Hydrogenophaga crassostreae]
MAAVAIIGAGNMGGAMVARLCELGWAVTVCDLDPVRQAQAKEAGARLVESPAEAAAALGEADVLILCVVTAEQCLEVLFGANGATECLKAGQVVMLCPTISPEDVENIGSRLAELGVACIDAPMSGGPARARDGSMSLMLAAPVALIAQHESLLAALSNQLIRISERPGDGARTKLVNNLLAGINLVGAAEAMALAEKLGLDLGTTLDVIERSSGQSWIGSDRMRRAIAGDFEPRAHVTLLEKDTGLAVQAARAVGFEGPLGQRVASTFARAHAAGLADLDDAALFTLLRKPG